MSGQPPYFIDPQLASRCAALKETVWLRIGALQTAMNDRDRALNAFEKVLRVNPTNIHAMTQVGAVLAKKERYTQAVGYLQRAIAAESTCGEAWAVLAHCYVMTDDLPKAYQAYQNALNHLQDPSDPNLWYGIGLLYDRYGSLDNALEAFLAVLRIAPNFERAIEVCFCIGIIYKEQRKLDEAMQYFNKVSLAPNPPPPLTRADGWYQIGHVNELKRDIPKALDMYKLALRENPHHAKTLQNLGWLEHSHKNDSREAIRLLQMSLDADQNDGQTWYLLGRVYMALREFRQAYDAYQQAVYRDGRNATFWCSIGVLYYQMNQYRDAMDAYARAIRLNPQVSEVWYDLGTLYESCGQTNDAIDAYRRAADLAPENTQITERLQVLQNNLSQGNAVHPQQQSQPMTSQPALQQPHPQLPPPQAHLPQQQPPGLAQQPPLPPPQQDQVMQPQPSQPHPQSQPQTSQAPLPPAPGHSQQQHPQLLQNHQLQPIGLRQGVPAMQQTIPMLSQHQPPHSSGIQPLPRHIMQHPLQQPPGSVPSGQGSTVGNPSQPPHAMHPSSMHTNQLPHLTMPNQGNQGQTNAQGQGSQTGAVQRPDPTDPRTQQQSAHLGRTTNQLPQPLPQPINHHSSSMTRGLPQLPSLQNPDAGNVRPGQGSAKQEATVAGDNANPNQQAPLPQLRIAAKDGGPNQLEQIPSLQQRTDAPSFGQTHPSQMGQGPRMPPIPSLAPLVQDGSKPGNPDGPPSLPGPSLGGQTLPPPPNPVSDQNNSALKRSPLAPLQTQGDQKMQDTGSTLPSVSATMGDGRGQVGATSSGHQGNVDSQMNTTGSTVQDGGAKDANMLDASKNDGRRAPPNGGPMLPPPDSMAASSSNGHEDAKLLHSVAMGPGASPKGSVGGPGAGPTTSSSPPVPALPIPRSAPAPRPNNDKPDLRIGTLGASSLTKFGRPQPTPLSSAKMPAALPSPLAPPRKAGGLPGASSGLMSSPMTNTSVPPLKSAPGGMNASSNGLDALPSPSSLPVLPALTGKAPEVSNEDNRCPNSSMKSALGDGSKNLNSMNGPGGMDGTSSQDKPRTFGGIPRSVPIPSLSGNEAKGSPRNRDGVPVGNKRDVSPCLDSDKTYKRPRVNESHGVQNDDERRRRSEENGERDGIRMGDNDMRMSDTNGRDESGRESQKNDGDGRMGTPIATDPGRPRSLTPRGSGPPLPIPNNAPLPSFRSTRERMNMGAGKSNAFGSGESRMKSPVLSLSSRSPGPLHLRSAPIGSFNMPKSQRPLNVGRPRDGPQAGRPYSRGMSPRSGGSLESDDKGLVRSDSKNSSGMGPNDEGRRDNNSGDKDHGSTDAKAAETAGTAS